MSNQVNKNIKRNKQLCRWNRVGEPICGRCQQNDKKWFCVTHYELWIYELRQLRKNHDVVNGDTAMGGGASTTFDEGEWSHWDLVLQRQITCRPTVTPAKKKQKMQICIWEFNGEHCTKQTQSSNRLHLCKRHNDAHENIYKAGIQQGTLCMPTNAVANVNLPVVVGRGIEGEFHSVQSCVGNPEDSLQVSRDVGHADNTPGQLVVPPAIYMREQLQWRDNRIDYLSKTVETMHRAIDTLSLNVRHLQTSLESQGEAMERGKKSDFYNGCTPAYEFTMDAMSFASTLDTRFNDQETDRADNMVDNQV